MDLINYVREANLIKAKHNPESNHDGKGFRRYLMLVTSTGFVSQIRKHEIKTQGNPYLLPITFNFWKNLFLKFELFKETFEAFEKKYYKNKMSDESIFWSIYFFAYNSRTSFLKASCKYKMNEMIYYFSRKMLFVVFIGQRSWARMRLYKISVQDDKLDQLVNYN